MMLSDLLFRLRAVFRRNAMERELDDELRFHIEHQVEAHRRAGLSEAEARRRARIAVGGLEQLKEECRDARGSGFVDATLQDLRYAVRALRASPGFTLVAVLSLALGIGANTAVFTVVNALLLRTLPVRDPQDLVIVLSSTKSGVKGVGRRNSSDRTDPKTGRPTNNTFSSDMLREFRTRSSDVLEVFGFFSPGRVGVVADDTSSIAYATVVSGNYFDGLGVPMALGRPLVESDDQPGASTIVVTYNFWQRSLSADAAILGRVLRVNGVPMTVVGVTAAGFTGISAGGFDGPVDVFAPLNAVETLARWFRSGKPRTAPDLWWIQLMARRRRGVTDQLATARLTSVFQATLRDSGVAALQNAEDPKIVLAPGDKGLDSSLRRRIERPVLVLFGVVGVVLLLACVNVANLLVARAAARQREMAVRLSLGAGRGRIIRQLLTENLFLSVLGTSLGLLLSVWGARLVASLLTVSSERVELNLTLDLRVLAFTVLASLLTGVVFGLTPALQATRVDIAPNLKQNVSASVRPGRFALGKLLLAGQVALTVLVLIGSGLLLRTLSNLYKLDAGFVRERVLLLRIDPGLAGYGPEQAGPLHDRVLESIRSMPGVLSATAMSHPFITGWHNGTMLSSPEVEDGRPIEVWMNTVSPEFFAAFNIPVVAGRPFSPRDTASAPLVVVLNQTAATRFFGSRLAVGRTLRRHAGDQMIQVEVVGVARDAKYDSLRKSVQPTVFFPYAQDKAPFSGRAYAVRTGGDPAALAGAIRQAISSIDRNLVPMDMKTQTRQIEESLHQERLFATLLTFFGFFSLLLAAIGLHGVAAYTASRRTREIGLRLALGARPSDVFGLVSGHVLLPVAAGMGAGLAASWAAGRWIESMLFGVERLDPVTIASASLILGAVALASAFLPAWRAAHLDPMTALRAE